MPRAQISVRNHVSRFLEFTFPHYSLHALVTPRSKMPNNQTAYIPGNPNEFGSEDILLLDKDQSNSHLYVKTGVATRKRPSPTTLVSNLSSSSSVDLNLINDSDVIKQQELRTLRKSSSVFSEAGPDELRSLENIGKTKSQQAVDDQVAMLRKMLGMSMGVAFLLSLVLASSVFGKSPSSAPVEHLGLHARYSKRWMQDTGDFVLHEDIVVTPGMESPTHNDTIETPGKVALSLRQLDQLNLLVTIANVGPSAADANVPDSPGIPHGPPIQLWDELQRMGDLGTADPAIISALADGAAMAADVIQDPNSPLVYTKCFVRTRSQTVVPTVYVLMLVVANSVKVRRLHHHLRLFLRQSSRQMIGMFNWAHTLSFQTVQPFPRFLGRQTVIFPFCKTPTDSGTCGGASTPTTEAPETRRIPKITLEEIQAARRLEADSVLVCTTAVACGS